MNLAIVNGGEAGDSVFVFAIKVYLNMNEQQSETIGFRPLYLQVREKLAHHLSQGRWQPGAKLPSEYELAAELGVSQGTVRKALDKMTAEKILIRRQGLGTYVAEFGDNRIMFQFFRLVPDEGERMFPIGKIVGRSSGRANSGETHALQLGPGKADVWRLERVRFHAELPVLCETISLCAQRFPGFGDMDDIQNNVYQLYSERWGATITKASEKLTAILATPSDAKHLKCAPGTPLLRVERIAFDINDQPVEYRVFRCLTEFMHYASDLD